jgi:medium-chain acyl-[acyl-carrier-protein] hydrolase
VTRAHDAWLPFPASGDGTIQLFCLPPAGGSAQVFRGWDEALPARVEVCPVELPGRGTRFGERAFTSISALALAASPALVSRPDRPFAFFGHSMGALLAFELARELRRSYGLTPEHLFVAANEAPQAQRAETTHALAGAAFVERLRELGGTPSEVLANSELFELLRPALRADLEASETYVFVREPPLDCPISVFGGLEDTSVEADDLHAWREHTTAAFSVSMLPGDHFFPRTARRELLAALAGALIPTGETVA